MNLKIWSKKGKKINIRSEEFTGNIKVGKSIKEEDWYYIYTIERINRVFMFFFKRKRFSFIMSASPDNPTLPKGFKNPRRISAVRNTSSGKIIPFTQEDGSVSFNKKIEVK